MGYQELISALEREAEENIGRIWQEAQASAALIRAEAEEKLRNVENHCCREHISLSQGLKEDVLTQTMNKAKALVLEAGQAISVRLYERAFFSLRSLRDDHYKKNFAALCRELPPCRWERAVVNPEDRKLAVQLFPSTEVFTDPSIIGGISVSGLGGKFHVDNTLEKRLERKWPDIMPLVFKRLQRHLTEHGTARED